MKIVRNLIAAFAVISSMLVASVAIAGTETNVSSGLTAKGPGLAVHGYDVVAYFTEGRPKVGRAKYSTVYNDATYRFASEEHLDTFEDAPEKLRRNTVATAPMALPSARRNWRRSLADRRINPAP